METKSDPRSAEQICRETCRHLDGDMMLAMPQMAGHVVVLHSDECVAAREEGENGQG